jgi:hypothetical protein
MNKSELNKKIAQQIKQTHFTIGDPKIGYSKETSHGANFIAPNARRGSTPSQGNQNDVEMKHELRKAHFNFGHE